MNGQKETSVLVDTCFLISLVNEGDAQHTDAETYFRHFMTEKVPLYLSIISLSEFQQKQDPEIIENFRVITFGMDEVAAQHKHFGREIVSGLPAKERVSVKDDIKIIATCLAHKIEAVLSVNDDFNVLARGRSLRIIDYRVPLKNYLGQLL